MTTMMTVNDHNHNKVEEYDYDRNDYDNDHYENGDSNDRDLTNIDIYGENYLAGDENGEQNKPGHCNKNGKTDLLMIMSTAAPTNMMMVCIKSVQMTAVRPPETQRQGRAIFLFCLHQFY